MISSLVTLAESARESHRITVERGHMELAAELRKLGFAVAHLLAMAARLPEAEERTP